MNHADLAREYFLKGYNCAQSVALAFSDLTNIDEVQAVRLASSFGGGMGGLRETCGAVSGMLIVAGLLMGYDEPNNLEVKQAYYARVQALVNAFIERNGTMNCRSPAPASPSPPPPPSAPPNTTPNAPASASSPPPPRCWRRRWENDRER